MIKMSDEQKQQIKDIVDLTVANYIDNLPRTIREMLDNSIEGIIGLRDGKFDSEANGNGQVFLRSLIHECIKNECYDQIADIALKLISKLRQDDVTKEIENAARKEYIAELRSTVMVMARGAAQSDAAAIVDNLKRIKIGSENTTIEDPNSFDGFLGDHQLKHYIGSL